MATTSKHLPAGARAEASAGHVVRFYETDGFLVDALRDFVRDGLSVGDACIVIAEGDRREPLEQRLAAAGVDLCAAQAGDAYLWLDAASTLAQIQVDGALDAVRFAQFIGAAITRAAGRGVDGNGNGNGARRSVRIFGEMVALLWAQGDQAEALHLERLWNELQHSPSVPRFSLFCAYPMQGFAGADNEAALIQVCQQHSHVIPAESYSDADDSDARLRATVLLQQKAASLEAEIADAQQLQHISSQLIREDDIHALYEQILDAAIAVMRSDMGSMQMLYPERNELRLLAQKGFDPASAAFWEWVRVDSGSTCGVALNAGARVIAPDVETCDFMAGTEDLDFYRLSGIRAVQSTPLVARDGHLVGMISTHWRRPYQPSERELGLLDILARQAADLLEHKRADEALRESAERLRMMAESMPQMIFTATPSGDIDYFNPQWMQFTGLSFEQIRDWSWTQVIHPDDVAENVRLWRHSIETGEPFYFEHRFRRADGVYRWYVSRAVAVRDTSGRITMWIGSNTDIDEQKQLEARKNAFISMTSHELKTPVTSLKAFTQILQKRMKQQEADPQAQLILDRMDAQLTRLTSLIGDLLDMSRMQAGTLALRLSRFGMDALVRETVENVQAMTTTHQVQVDGRVYAEVEGDRDRLGQVLINLLTNAVKYSPRADHVIVRLCQTSDGDTDWVEVAVQDFGIGIAEEEHERIFEQFYQVADREGSTYPGLGIGLHIARTLVERHGGRLWLESQPGAGSTFHFALLAAGGELDRPDTAI